MMHQPLPVFIGLRYLKGRSGDKFGRFVSYMSTAGITIGVMALITVLSVMNGFEDQLKSRILGVLPQVTVTSSVEQPIDESVISQWVGVNNTAPVETSDAVLQSASSLGAGLLMGIDPQSHEPLSYYMVRGAVDNLIDGEYRIAIGRQMANQLDLAMGDRVRVMITSASQFTPLGRIPSQRKFTVAGIFDTATDVDSQLILANINDVSRLMRLPASKPVNLRLFVDDPFNVPTLEKRALSEGYQWSDWRELRGELFQAVKMEKNMMGLMLSLIILVAAFNMISALIMVVMEKQAEVAILKTQGMTNRGIVTIFVVQGASSGVIGAVLGGLFGTLLAVYLNDIMMLLNINIIGGGVGLPVVINPSQTVFVVVCAIALSFFATLFPSIKAASVPPAEALRYE